MTMPRAVCCLLLLILAACAAGPKPAAPVKDVATADQGRYWRVDHTSLPADMPAEDGCFRVQTVIDSDGKLFEPKVLASVGKKTTAWLPGFLAQLRFQPAPENPGRTPIRTTLTWTLTQSVETSTVSAASAAAAVKAAVAAPPPPDTRNWNQACQAQMDKQMGITPRA